MPNEIAAILVLAALVGLFYIARRIGRGRPLPGGESKDPPVNDPGTTFPE